MSHSPSSQADISIATDPESQFQQSLRHINQLLDSDGSLSGREPNCMFLNTQNGKFATVSGVSGFDFPDDARALAVTDWDGDGDLDLWVTNRTGPRIRFLQNHLGEGRRYVAVKLEATKGNRDAIGARVEVVFQGNNESRLVRTLRAGEGFLSQSSKWLHFGLGDDPMERIMVTWPDGSEQSISDVKVNSHLHITQGQSVVRYEDRRLDAAVFADHAPVVDETEFDAVRQGRSAQELLDELAQLAPASEELCLTHGDYCLPNIIVDDDCVAGFVDLGRLGVGDRYRDLALVRRSLDYNGCADLIPLFFQEYGLPTPNADKLYLYQLLDEFF